MIVLLQVKTAENLTGKRQSRIERQAAIQSVRESASQSLANIAEIIQYFDGQVLVDCPDALGSIPVEITAAGIVALAKSEVVKAVMEDRSIYPVYSSDSFGVKFGSF